jgi:hypothetical protein
MTLAAVNRDAFPALILRFFMATDALPVKNFPEISLTLRPVARLASDPGLAGFKFAFFQDVLPLLIPVMAVLAGKARLDMKAVRKRNRRAVPILKSRTFEGHLIRLSPEG